MSEKRYGKAFLCEVLTAIEIDQERQLRQAQADARLALMVAAAVWGTDAAKSVFSLAQGENRAEKEEPVVKLGPRESFEAFRQAKKEKRAREYLADLERDGKHKLARLAREGSINDDES